MTWVLMPYYQISGNSIEIRVKILTIRVKLLTIVYIPAKVQEAGIDHVPNTNTLLHFTAVAIL